MSWPQWSVGNIQNINSGAAALPLLTQGATAASTVLPPNAAQYTPEQWTQMQQQNWQQWAQWQQQYQQWQQQYGAEFQKSLNAMNTHVTSTLPLTTIMPNTSVPPPLPNQPIESKPPLPPEEPPSNNTWQGPGTKQLTNYSSVQPTQTNSYNTTNEANNWNRNNNNQNWLNQTNQRNQRQFAGSKNNYVSPTKTNYNEPSQDGSLKRPTNSLETNDSKKLKFEPPLNKPQTEKMHDWLSASSSSVQESKQISTSQTSVSGDSVEEISEAEKKFIKQFADWESQFAQWKKQNQDHPNKTLYREYEKKWEAWRAQLLERREHMKKKRLMKIGVDKGSTSKLGSTDLQLTNFNKPANNDLKSQQSNVSESVESNFLLSTNSKNEIPGLDLVKDDNVEDKTKDALTSKKQDMDAISKGIVTILSDQKIMSMLTLVSQNQSIAPASKSIDPVPNVNQSRTGTNSVDSLSITNDAQNISNEDYSNQDISNCENFSNVDEQTRTSFEGQYDNDTKSPYSDYDARKEDTNREDPNNFRDERFHRNFNSNEINYFSSEKGNDFKNTPDNFNRSEETNLNRDFGTMQDTLNITTNRNNSRSFERFNRPQDNYNDPYNSNMDDGRRDNYNTEASVGRYSNMNKTQNFYNRNSDDFKINLDNFRNTSDDFNSYRNAPLENKGNISNLFNPTDRTDFNRKMDTFNRSADNFNRISNNREQEKFDEIGSRKNYNSEKFSDVASNPDKRRHDDGRFVENRESTEYLEEKPVVMWPRETDSYSGDKPSVESFENSRDDITKPNADDIWKPTNVIDYDHKTLKNDEFDIIIETFYTFDYHHKPVNRIPYPERPRWLTNILSYFREFEPQIKRVFERYSDRFDRRPYQDTYRRYDYCPEDRYSKRDYAREYENRLPPDSTRYNENYDKKVFENKFTSNKKPLEIERRSFDVTNRRYFTERDVDTPFVRNEPNTNENFDSDKSLADNDDDDPFPDFEAFTASKSNIDFKPLEELKKDVILIEDILNKPGRYNRPPRIVIIIRGPPGSGKTFLAKLIKDKEVENGGSPPRILSLDDYFMVEQEKEVEEDGRVVKVKEMVYEYEEGMENSYKTSLLKAFKKTITDGYFPFIIVDNINDKVKDFSDMWSFAKQNGFQVYTCELELDIQLCTKRNIHGRLENEIERCIKDWEQTPSHYYILDATSLIQAGSIPEVEMEEINSPAQNDYDSDAENEDQVRSKWDTFDCSLDNLAKLDGTSKPLRPSRTMEDYLQLDDEWFAKAAEPGKKRVRWADLEERKEQEKMRAIGFVVGQTNWNRMMDPTHGSSALTQTKYIERVRKY